MGGHSVPMGNQGGKDAPSVPDEQLDGDYDRLGPRQEQPKGREGGGVGVFGDNERQIEVSYKTASRTGFGAPLAVEFVGSAYFKPEELTVTQRMRMYENSGLKFNVTYPSLDESGSTTVQWELSYDRTIDEWSGKCKTAD